MTCGDFWKALIALWPQANSRVHYSPSAGVVERGFGKGSVDVGGATDVDICSASKGASTKLESI